MSNYNLKISGVLSGNGEDVTASLMVLSEQLVKCFDAFNIKYADFDLQASIDKLPPKQ